MDIKTEPDNVVVLLSSYNGSKYIEEQIQSILTQEYSRYITVFIRDDCSSDSTLQIVKSIACPRNREVRILEDRKHNIGPQRSFLTLIESAPEAAYYFLSDQDDVWKQDHISSAVEMLEGMKDKPSLYCSNYSLADTELNIVDELAIKDKPQFTPLKAFFYNKIPGCCMAWNNELQKYLRQMHPENVMMHDRYIASFASFIGEVVYDPRSHILHRIHGDNVIGTGNKKIELVSWIKEKSSLLIKREDYDVCEMAEEFLRVGKTIAHPEYVKDIELLRDYRESRRKTKELLKHPDTSENNRGGYAVSCLYAAR